MSDLWIPVSGIIGFTLILITSFILSSKHKVEVQNTIRKMLDKGDSLTPELLEKLGTFRSQKLADLRRGLALVSLGFASVFAGLVLEEARTGIAFGVFPLMLGLAFLLTWKMNSEDD